MLNRLAPYAIGAAFGALALAAAQLAPPAPAPETYAFIGVGDGHSYIIDSGLTADDCRGLALTNKDMRFSYEYCELEPIPAR